MSQLVGKTDRLLKQFALINVLAHVRSHAKQQRVTDL